MKRFLFLLVLVGVVNCLGVGCNRNLSATDALSVVNHSTAEITSSTDALRVTADDAIYFVASSTPIRGYYARPERPGMYPGIVVIHEWWGLNDTIKAAARQLAAEGYQVLAVDLYQGKVASTSAEAQKFVGLLNQAQALRNLRAAANFLREHSAGDIASLGWCFGGGQSLQLALSGEKMAATVLYYGTPVSDAVKLAHISWPVLGIFGDKDRSISLPTIRAFDEALTQVRVEHEVYVYPGVGHAFANPTGANYAPNETKDAWQKTLAFLKKNLSSTTTPYLAPRTSLAWDKAVPLLQRTLKPFFDAEVGRLFPPLIERVIDVTNDGEPEALVHLGDGGATTNFVTLVRLVNGVPKPLMFSGDKTSGAHYFVEGGSVKHSDQVVFLPFGVLYAATWERDDEGRVSRCSTTAYVWNAQKEIMEKNDVLNTEIQKEYCARQATVRL